MNWLNGFSGISWAEILIYAVVGIFVLFLIYRPRSATPKKHQWYEVNSSDIANAERKRKVERREKLVTRLNLYATKYKDDNHAASALMSFFRGDCQHISDKNDKKGKCELCGADVPHIAKN